MFVHRDNIAGHGLRGSPIPRAELCHNLRPRTRSETPARVLNDVRVGQDVPIVVNEETCCRAFLLLLPRARPDGKELHHAARDAIGGVGFPDLSCGRERAKAKGKWQKANGADQNLGMSS